MAVQVAQGQVVQVRRETPARWQKALTRAIAQGLEVFVAADTGERFVTSASHLDTLHRTDGYTCTCDAALGGDPVCQHRAVVRYVQGCLGVTTDTEPQLAGCVRCNGCGRIPNDYLERYDTCPICGGTGVVPAPATRPYGLPAVEIMATAA